MKATTTYKKGVIEVLTRISNEEKAKELELVKHKKLVELKSKHKKLIDSYYAKNHERSILINEIRNIENKIDDTGLGINYKDVCLSNRTSNSITVSTNYNELLDRLSLQVLRCETTESVDEILNKALGKGFADDIIKIRPSATKLLTSK